MNARTTILLVVILVVLGVVATLTETNRKKQWKPAGNKLLPEYVAGNVDGLDLTKGNLRVELAKQNGNWVVETENDQPADTALVSGILDNLTGLTSDDLVSTNAESHPALEVDSTGVDVVIHAGGDEVGHIIVGKPGPDGMSTYVRLADQDNVYRVPVYLRSQVDRGDQTWRNKTVLKVPQAELASYTTTDEKGSSVTVVQDPPGNWKMTAPQEGPVDPGLMPMLLQTLTNVSARAFADSVTSLADVGLEPPQRTIEVVTRSGERHKLLIGTQNPANQNYVKREDSETIYLVPAGRWNTVFRKPSELLVQTGSESTLESSAPGD
jgi:hypothetical protein